MCLAYLGLGSNLGARAAQLSRALEHLRAEAVQVRRVSAVYESDPVGPVSEQPRFYNLVAEIETELAPRALLGCCLEVERQMGRTRTRDKGPRNIDLDLLLVGAAIERSPELQLPHPELARRAFVLRPLLDLDPALTDPRDGLPLRRFLGTLDAQELLRVGALPAVVAAERGDARSRDVGD